MRDAQYYRVRNGKLYIDNFGLNRQVIDLSRVVKEFAPFYSREIFSYSTISQEPVSLNTPYDILFENNVSAPDSRVVKISPTTFEIVEAGNYSIGATLSVNRDSTQQVAYIVSRFVKSTDGGTTFQQLQNPYGLSVRTNSWIIPLRMEVFDQFEAGDQVKIQIGREGAPADARNDGGIQGFSASGLGWGDIYSANVLFSFRK